MWLLQHQIQEKPPGTHDDTQKVKKGGSLAEKETPFSLNWKGIGNSAALMMFVLSHFLSPEIQSKMFVIGVTFKVNLICFAPSVPTTRFSFWAALNSFS